MALDTEGLVYKNSFYLSIEIYGMQPFAYFWPIVSYIFSLFQCQHPTSYEILLSQDYYYIFEMKSGVE